MQLLARFVAPPLTNAISPITALVLRRNVLKINTSQMDLCVLLQDLFRGATRVLAWVWIENAKKHGVDFQVIGFTEVEME